MDKQLVLDEGFRQYFLAFFAGAQRQSLEEFLAAHEKDAQFSMRMRRDSHPDGGVDVEILVTDLTEKTTVRRPLMVVRYVDGKPIDLLAPVINGVRRLPFGTNLAPV